MKMDEENNQATSDLSEMKEENDYLHDTTPKEQWSNKIDAVLSFLGYCVGLGNIWRFPYICMRNGGGAFLVPFFIFLFICGLPFYFLEMTIGQFSGKSAMLVWEVCPIFKGVGITVAITSVVTCVYFNVIMSWTLFYLGSSFINPLPWRECKNYWNTPGCISNRDSTNSMLNVSSIPINVSEEFHRWTNYTTSDEIRSNTTYSRITPEEEFWQYKVLNLSSGVEHIGNINVLLSLCLLSSYVLLYLFLVKGVKSSGKVVYVTATLPYILLTALLIRGLLLPGAADGVLFYIKPNFYKLAEPQVWVEAALQVFYSLGPLWGPIITFGSYNKFNNNCYRDSFILVIACEGTSIFGGFVIFTFLGYMAHTANLPISKVIQSGPGLGFIAYPEALGTLPLPNLWSVLFFLMLLTAGLDGQMAFMETVFAGFSERFQFFRKRRLLVSAVMCVVFFLLALPLSCEGGIYIFQIIDWYIAALSPSIIGLVECLIFGWIYGVDKLSQDLNMMINREIPIFFRVCWRYITPLIVLCLLIFTLTTYKPPTYGTYQCPSYVVGIGWTISFLTVLPIPVYACVVVQSAKGETLTQKIKFAFKPSSEWKPVRNKDFLMKTQK